MRIGIDCKTILNAARGEYAGVGHYTHHLVRSLIKIDKVNQYVLFFYDHELDTSLYEAENVQVVKMPLASYKKYLPFIYSHVIAPLIYLSHNLDILHVPAPIRPLLYLRKNVVTVHDLAIYKNVKWFPKLRFFFSKILVPFSIRFADKVIAVSQNTANDIKEIFKIRPERIGVVYEGVEIGDGQIEESKKEMFQLLYPYFLYVGTIEPRKNLENLIDAFELYLESNPETKMKLVLAGKYGWKYEAVKQRVEQKKFKNKIIYLGYVTSAEKFYLMRNAAAFVYPTFYEGFGLQLLEAMSCSLPVLTSNEGSVSEIVLDNAVLVNPYDINDLAHGLVQIIEYDELRNRLVEHGLEIVKNYTWDRCAQETLEVYKSLAK